MRWCNKCPLKLKCLSQNQEYLKSGFLLGKKDDHYNCYIWQLAVKDESRSRQLYG